MASDGSRSNVQIVSLSSLRLMASVGGAVPELRAESAARVERRREARRRGGPEGAAHGHPTVAILVSAHGAWSAGGIVGMDEEGLDLLVAAVRAHYRAPGAPPLLLSSFGQRNKDLVSRLKDSFNSLAAAVRAAGEDRIRFIDTTAGREAVAPADRAVDLQQRLHDTTASQRQAAALFDTLPRSVQLAFCIRVEAGEHVALDVVRPFRFAKVTAPDLIRPVQRLVAERFRKPGLSLRSASVHDKHDLWNQFVAWAQDAQVDLEAFRGADAAMALARLLAAQPADVLPRLVIPADIAQLLLKHS